MSKVSSSIGEVGISSTSYGVTRFDDEDCWEQELYEKIHQRNNNGNGEPLETITEIDDERDSSITSDTTVSNNVNGDTTSKDVVCVCVDRNQRESSMEALSWTLQHWITPSSTLCLLYVFPFIRLIPSPIGYMERVVVDNMYVDYHIEQIKDKKKLLLRKFIDSSQTLADGDMKLRSSNTCIAVEPQSAQFSVEPLRRCRRLCSSPVPSTIKFKAHTTIS